METKSCKKDATKYSCEKCDFYSNNKHNYEKHLQTKKHFGNMETNWKQKNCNICPCGREYQTRSGLYKHKKTCTYKPEAENITIETTEIPTRNTLGYWYLHYLTPNSLRIHFATSGGTIRAWGLLVATAANASAHASLHPIPYWTANISSPA